MPLDSIKALFEKLGLASLYTAAVTACHVGLLSGYVNSDENQVLKVSDTADNPETVYYDRIGCEYRVF